MIPGKTYLMILEEEKQSLLDDAIFLECLREAGVDNWEGYDEACRLFQERLIDPDA